MPIYDGEGFQTKKISKKKNTSAVQSPTASFPDQGTYQSDGATTIFGYVQKKVEDARGNSTTWMDKQAKFNRLRMRIKKTKTFPFVGCSNIRMPTAEIKIRKLKAALVQVIFGMRPIVAVVPPPSGRWETAQKIEKWIDHLIMDKMVLKPKAIIAIDQEVECGFYLMKPYWNVEMNRRQEEFHFKDISMEEAQQLFDGKTTKDQVVEFLQQKFDVDQSDWVADENDKILDEVATKVMKGIHDFTFYVQDVLYAGPDVALIDPAHIYVPVDAGYNPQDAQCLVHEFYLPMHVLESNAITKGWDIEGVSEIKTYNNYDTRSMKDNQRDLAEGINRLNGPSNSVRIWEYYGWYDLDGDGVKEKVVITCAPDFKKVMRKKGLPFSNGKFPFVKLFYELTSDRWYAHRGLVELAEDIIKEIDVQHNMKIDSQTIRNAPMFVYRAGMVNPNLVQMIPNQGIPVNGMQPLQDSIQVLNAHNPNVEFSYKDEQMILESKVEEMVGQIDFTLQSMINRRQPRTLGEVELQNQNAQNVFSLDADMNRDQFAELFNMCWDLWCQYGDEKEEFSYFGANGWEKINLSKEEIQGKYKMTVRGNDQNTNPQTKMQKAQQIVQAITNPALIQMGVITPIQAANGMKRFFQQLDVEGWEEFVNMNPQPPPPPPLSSIIKTNYADLMPGEKAQVLHSEGIAPDVHGQALAQQDKLNEQMMQHAQATQPPPSPTGAQQ